MPQKLTIVISIIDACLVVGAHQFTRHEVFGRRKQVAIYEPRGFRKFFFYFLLGKLSENYDSSMIGAWERWGLVIKIGGLSLIMS